MQCKIQRHVPEKTICVAHPLVYKLDGYGPRIVRQLDPLQGEQQQVGVIVQSSDGHLETHGAQLTGLHPAGQAFQNQLHKEWDALEEKERSELYLETSKYLEK